MKLTESHGADSYLGASSSATGLLGLGHMRGPSSAVAHLQQAQAAAAQAQFSDNEGSDVLSDDDEMTILVSCSDIRVCLCNFVMTFVYLAFKFDCQLFMSSLCVLSTSDFVLVGCVNICFLIYIIVHVDDNRRRTLGGTGWSPA